MKKYRLIDIIACLFLFLMIVTVLNALQQNDITEDFSELQCTDLNATYINGVCYTCPQGLVFDNNTLKCKDMNQLSCSDPSSVLVSDTCYGCPFGQKYNASTLSCETLPVKYRCLNNNDTLVGNTCYECIGKNSTLNTTTLQCENIKNAYYPLDTYIPEQNTCKSGYILQQNECYKCNPNDIIKGGMCEKIESVKPNDNYPAVHDNSYAFGMSL